MDEKHEFVSCMIQDTQGDYRKMVAYCKENHRSKPKIIAHSPNGMGCFKFEHEKYIWSYERDPYGFMDMVRVEKAY